MLWTVFHRWLVGARFVFNCYQHWAQLVIRQPGKDPVVLHIKEGVTQGDPTSMITYSITLLPLAKETQRMEKEVMAPYFEDDVASTGRRYTMRESCEPEKSIHISDNSVDVEKARAIFTAVGLN
eukprot:2467100-Ditylum_brightwellii.AAC.1